jgi:hypothetical protein
MKSEKTSALIRTIAKDVATIKNEIVSLKIKVAVTASTVAFVVTIVTGLLFNELSKRPSPASATPIHERRTPEFSPPTGLRN